MCIFEQINTRKSDETSFSNPLFHRSRRAAPPRMGEPPVAFACAERNSARRMDGRGGVLRPPRCASAHLSLCRVARRPLFAARTGASDAPPAHRKSTLRHVFHRRSLARPPDRQRTVLLGCDLSHIARCTFPVFGSLQSHMARALSRFATKWLPFSLAGLLACSRDLGRVRRHCVRRDRPRRLATHPRRRPARCRR